MKKIFLTIYFLLVCCLVFTQEVAHTIRCRDGVVLVLGTPDAILKTKEYLLDINKNTVKYVAGVLKNIDGISKIEEYYKDEEITFPKRKLISLSVQDAINYGLIPDITDKSFSDVVLLLEMFGYKVLYTGKPIGKTSIYPPVNIVVKSAGAEVGNFAHIYVDGVDWSKNQRGYNIVVINQETGKIEASESFDTRAEPGGAENSQKMKKFLEEIQDGRIVVCAVKDEASKYLTSSTFLQLKKIGGKIYLKRRFHKRFSHAIIGIKGIKSGMAEEDFGFREINLSALKDTTGEKEKLISQNVKFILLPQVITPKSIIEIFQ